LCRRRPSLLHAKLSRSKPGTPKNSS
jgi:hypothetical protein